MPLLEEHGSYWLLVCVNCHLHHFVVYDSLVNAGEKS